MILYHRYIPRKNALSQTPPLVILHGFLGSSGNWMSISKELSKETDVWSFDLRNHGMSEQNKEINYTVMAKDIWETCEKFSIKNPILLGHSMGGKVAIKFCSLYPKELSGLIIADISPKRYEKILFIEIVKKLKTININSFFNRKEAEEKFKSVFNNEILALFLLKNAKLDREKKCLTWSIPIKILCEKSDFLKEDVTPKSTVKLPTLFLRGEKSDYINKSDEKLIEKVFLQSEIFSIPKAGHWVNTDNPEVLVKKVKEFFKSI